MQLDSQYLLLRRIRGATFIPAHEPLGMASQSGPKMSALRRQASMRPPLQSLAGLGTVGEGHRNALVAVARTLIADHPRRGRARGGAPASTVPAAVTTGTRISAR
jgi:hypothetical protein